MIRASSPMRKVFLFLSVLGIGIMMIWYFQADSRLKIRETGTTKLTSEKTLSESENIPVAPPESTQLLYQKDEQVSTDNSPEQLDHGRENMRIHETNRANGEFKVTTSSILKETSAKLVATENYLSSTSTCSSSIAKTILATQSTHATVKSTIAKGQKMPRYPSTRTTHTIKPTTDEPTTQPTPPTTTPYYYGEQNCAPNPWRPTLVEIFAEWTKLSKKHNINYVLYAGTQLGQLRDEDIIPYDSDIDLLMDVKFFPKMKEIASQRGFDNSDGKIRLVVQPEFHINPSTNRKRYNCWGKQVPYMTDNCGFQEPLARLIKGSLHIDFYHFYDHGKTLEDFSEEEKKVYKRSEFYPLQPCTFMGLNTSCPNMPFRLLEIYFKHNRFMEPSRKCKGGKWV